MVFGLQNRGKDESDFKSEFRRIWALELSSSRAFKLLKQVLRVDHHHGCTYDIQSIHSVLTGVEHTSDGERMIGFGFRYVLIICLICGNKA